MKNLLIKFLSYLEKINEYFSSKVRTSLSFLKEHLNSKKGK
tara:strand:+ start:63 stop:185 length:123 start_codon:yes stop_codon:yes gene_type:complete